MGEGKPQAYTSYFQGLTIIYNNKAQNQVKKTQISPVISSNQLGYFLYIFLYIIRNIQFVHLHIEFQVAGFSLYIQVFFYWTCTISGNGICKPVFLGWRLSFVICGVFWDVLCLWHV